MTDNSPAVGVCIALTAAYPDWIDRDALDEAASSSTATNVLSRLDDAGLLDRRLHPKDARKRQVRLRAEASYVEDDAARAAGVAGPPVEDRLID